MLREDCVFIGYVGKPHGMNGEAKVILDVQYVEDYMDIKTFHLAKKDQPLERYKFTRMSLHNGKTFIAKIKGYNTRDEVATMMGCEIYFPLERLPELEEGEVFYFEILGFKVHDKTAGLIGTLRDIYETGADDLLVVDHPSGKEVLIPFMEPIYTHTDREAEEVHVDLPEGLLDLYVGEEEE